MTVKINILLKIFKYNLSIIGELFLIMVGVVTRIEPTKERTITAVWNVPEAIIRSGKYNALALGV